MNRRLYKYHNLPLYFWLTPTQAGDYNHYYRLIIEGPTYIPKSVFNHATEVELKVYRRVDAAYKRGIIPEDLYLDRSEPLLMVY